MRLRTRCPGRSRGPSRPSLGLATATLALAALATLGGCAREGAAERHFAEHREAMTKMQNDHDRIDQRLGALEIAQADDRRSRDGSAAVAGSATKRADATAAAPGAVASPRVVQLGGAGDGETADPNDPAARPEIRVVGAGGSGGSARRGRSAPLTESTRVTLDPEAKKAYEAALALVQGKQYDRGLEGLTSFLVRWPDHPYTENAMYWRGEAYFAKGEYLRSAEQFEAVLARFGGGSKGPDAMLKLGMCHDRLGAPDRAREYWDRLKSEYPKSDAARRIPSPSGTRDASPKGPKESR